MPLYFIDETDEMELEDVAKAIDEAGFNVAAVRVSQALHEINNLRDALADMLCGWRYIRQLHGDLYGVGWDRAQSKAEQAFGIGAGEPVPKRMFKTPNVELSGGAQEPAKNAAGSQSART